ncbi:Schwann cell myelin protein-like isoform X1 [Dendronephthya gigantea]|uniref:Schwann cell myelin protein-like isoform X1 n=1 Tax=Dendronephthya gigantea TaxID=151771 RepID=UPI00106AB1DB|nr:Schwann cell myelin protein-like isoform X1 [Dendronephthya gigantea]XP_028399295.1 Schwann cell myelin protein-like isoform X1 [Dendronephthya gigantea]
MVALNCSSPVILNEGDNFACLCKNEGGNSPANVTWYKNGVKFSNVGTERQKLILSIVGRRDRGTYKCVATSNPYGKYSDEKFIQVIIYIKPTNTMITFTKNPAVINGPLTITCASDGFPVPFYTIYHNGKVLSTEKWYIVPQVKWKDNGTYKCIAANTFGKDSVSEYLKVTEEPKPTVLSITRSTSRSVSSTSIKNREDESNFFLVFLLVNNYQDDVLFTTNVSGQLEKFRLKPTQTVVRVKRWKTKKTLVVRAVVAGTNQKVFINGQSVINLYPTIKEIISLNVLKAFCRDDKTYKHSKPFAPIWLLHQTSQGCRNVCSTWTKSNTMA